MTRYPLVTLGALLFGAAIHAQPVSAPLMALDELQPGMTGEVWTVFHGTTPESFSVEVTGVVRNALGPGKSLILCQLTDERVQKMGAVAGMSGSPLYINGKLAGALSYQVQKFETVRYAGFTPISDLLEVVVQSDQAALARENANRSYARIDPSSTEGLRPLSPVFAFGGVSPRVVDWLAPRFSEIGLDISALGGQVDYTASGNSTDRHPLRAGDAVSVLLASGDITLAATGTVSYVNGDRVLAFGHPMMGLGAVSLPMALSEIVTILPSNQSSLKVANTGEIIGTIDQDRLSAVAGRLGPGPEMIPIEILVDNPGQEHRVLNFSAARHSQLTPLAVGAGVAQAVMGSNEAGFSNGASLQADFVFARDQVVSTTSIFSGPQGVNQGLSNFTNDIGALLRNPYAEVFPEQIRIRVVPLEHNPLTTLEFVQLSRQKVTAEGKLTVTIGWRDYQGTQGREMVDVPVPTDWLGRKLEVIVTQGRNLDQLTGHQSTVASAQLRGFEAYLDFVRQARAPDGLTIAVVESASLFIDQTTETRDLPGSLARIAQSADQARYQVRQAVVPLWEKNILPGRLVPGLARNSFEVID